MDSTPGAVLGCDAQEQCIFPSRTFFVQLSSCNYCEITGISALSSLGAIFDHSWVHPRISLTMMWAKSYCLISSSVT